MKAVERDVAPQARSCRWHHLDSNHLARRANQPREEDADSAEICSSIDDDIALFYRGSNCIEEINKVRPKYMHEIVAVAPDKEQPEPF